MKLAFMSSVLPRATLAELGVEVAELIARPDHASYRLADAKRYAKKAEALGATAVLTTAKDAVKLAPLWAQSPPLRVVQVALEVTDPTAPDGERDWLERLIALAQERFDARAANGSDASSESGDGTHGP